MSSGFKMRGYTYPGKSPLKGKAKEKRAAAATKAEDAIAKMTEELGKEYKSSSILTPSKPGPPLKGSPAKAGFINWSEIATGAIENVVSTGVGAGIEALTKGKKKKTRDVPAASMGGQQFGGGAKIT